MPLVYGNLFKTAWRERDGRMEVDLIGPLAKSRWTRPLSLWMSFFRMLKSMIVKED